MNLLIIHNSINTPDHGNDATGAFIPEAINLTKYRTGLGDSVQRIPFDNSIGDKRKRGDAFLSLVRSAQPFDAFVYLGHGLRNSMSSAAIDQSRRGELVAALKSRAKSSSLVVTLFACSTGETTTGAADGDGGFADRLRDDLEAVGFVGWVDAHTCAAHTTQNPFVRRFAMPGPTAGGQWLVDPKSAEWGRWKSRLLAAWKADPFRFRFPWMAAEDVRAECG